MTEVDDDLIIYGPPLFPPLLVVLPANLNSGVEGGKGE